MINEDKAFECIYIEICKQSISFTIFDNMHINWYNMNI